MLRFAEAADIDRSQPLRFSFDGRKCVGYQGDTLASALIGCGILRTCTGAVLRRARGISGAGPFDDTAAVRLLDRGRRQIVAPASVALYDGLEARSVGGGRGGVIGRLLFGENEDADLRPLSYVAAAAAALRTSAVDAADAAVEKARLHTDVLIIGGGAAGMALALHAAAAGLRTLVCDRNDRPKIRAFPADAAVHAERAAALREAFAEATTSGRVRFLSRTQVLQRNEDGSFLALNHPDDVPGEGTARVYLIRARFAAAADGARELGLPFAGNDLPGVMSSTAVRLYAQRYGVSPGNALLVACNNDAAYETAFLLHRCGVKIKGIVDSRRNPGPIMQAALGRGIDVHQGTLLRAVEGKDRPEYAELVPAEASAEERRRQRRVISCDAVAVSGGFVPSRSEVFGTQTVRVGAAAGAGPGLGAVLHDVRRAADAMWRACAVAAPALVQEPPEETSEAVRCTAPDSAARETELPERVFVSGVSEWSPARGGHAAPTDVELPTADEAERCIALIRAIGTLSEADEAALRRRLHEPVRLLASAIGAVRIGARRLSPLHPAYDELQALTVPAGAFPRPAYFRREGAAARRGDPLLPDVRAEYEALTSGCAIIDRSADGAIRLLGPDAATLAAAFGGRSAPRPGCMGRLRPADAQGVLLGDVLCAVFDEHDVLLLPGCGDTALLTQRAEHLRMAGHGLLRVAVRDRREAEARLTLAGPKAAEVCRALLPDVRSNVCALELAGLRADAVFDTERQEIELCIPARHAVTLFRAAVRAGAVPVGEQARDIVRIERGLPGMSELRRSLQADPGGGGAAIIGIRTARKIALRDTPEYLSADSRRACITSWCYGPGGDRHIGLAVTEHRDAFLGRDNVTARIASAPDGVAVSCFAPTLEGLYTEENA